MSTFQRTAAFHTLGCKLNFAETSTIARQLTDAGYDKVSFDEKVCYFLNLLHLFAFIFLSIYYWMEFFEAIFLILIFH